jgi:hypothetical protein
LSGHRPKELALKSGQSLLLVAAAVAAAMPASAAELAIKLTLPEIQGTPRAPLRPYVAVWLRKEDNTFATNLAVWYQIEAKQRRAPAAAGQGADGARPARERPAGEQTAGDRPAGDRPAGDRPQRQRAPDNPKTPGGARWLNEVRQWWADSGNELQFPVDGLTTASRAAGTHELTFAGNDPKLAKLAPGNYKLMVEASREHGGEETVSIPFTWPAKSVQVARNSGKTELGAIELTVKP